MSYFSCGLQIRISEGPDKGRTFPLDTREVTIGRARTAGDRAPGWVLLNDPQISRIHADLVWNEEEKTYRLVHRSETNPTEVNGVEMKEAYVKIGDTIRVGGTLLDLQQADFRFGGVAPERIGQIQEARRAGLIGSNQALAFRDPMKEVEAHTSTTKANRKIALSTRPQLCLQVLSGEQQGQKLPLTGFQIQLGGSRPEELPEGDPWWDQDLTLEESALPYRCLALQWRELEKAFEVSFTRSVNISITLERRTDGTEWIAEMPMSSPVTLRLGDFLYVGRSAMQLVATES